MAKKKKEKQVQEKQFVFDAEKVQEITDKLMMGYKIHPSQNPWFKRKEVGVRRAYVPYAWSKKELKEFAKCAKDITYFANIIVK